MRYLDSGLLAAKPNTSNVAKEQFPHLIGSSHCGCGDVGEQLQESYRQLPDLPFCQFIRGGLGTRLGMVMLAYKFTFSSCGTISSDMRENTAQYCDNCSKGLAFSEHKILGVSLTKNTHNLHEQTGADPLHSPVNRAKQLLCSLPCSW